MNNKYYNIEEKKKTHKEKSVFGVVSTGLKKISFSKKEKEHSIAHVTFMNIPPLGAKRDAAYEVALGILKDKIDSTSSGELLLAYTDSLKLFSISEKAHKEMINTLTKTGKAHLFNTHGIYLRLFSDMISSALFVLSSSAIICADEQTVNYLLGNPKSEQSKKMLDLFSKCEYDLRQSIADLYITAEATVEKEKAKMKKHFSDDDRERYEISFREFLKKFQS